MADARETTVSAPAYEAAALRKEARAAAAAAGLDAPTGDESRHILRLLKWGEHFVATDISPAIGANNVYLYSLEEAARFLRLGRRGIGLSMSSGKSSISWVQVGRFVAWIRDAVGDFVLADAIERATEDAHCYRDEAKAFGRLVDMRISQLRAIIDEEALGDGAADGQSLAAAS